MTARLDVGLSEKWRKDIEKIESELERLDAKELDVDLRIDVDDSQWDSFERDHEDFLHTLVYVEVDDDDFDSFSRRVARNRTHRTEHQTEYSTVYTSYGEDRADELYRKLEDYGFEQDRTTNREIHVDIDKDARDKVDILNDILADVDDETVKIRTDVDDAELDALITKLEALDDDRVVQIYTNVNDLDNLEDRLDHAFRDREMRVKAAMVQPIQPDGGRQFQKRLDEVTFGGGERDPGANIKFRDVDRDTAERRLERLQTAFPEMNVVGGLRDTGDADAGDREFSVVAEMPKTLYDRFHRHDKFDGRFKRATINVQGGRVHFENEWDRLFEDVAKYQLQSRRLIRDSMVQPSKDFEEDGEISFFRNRGTDEVYARKEFDDKDLTVDFNLSKGEKRLFGTRPDGTEFTFQNKDVPVNRMDRKYMNALRRRAVDNGNMKVRELLKYDLIEAAYGKEAQTKLDNKQLLPKLDFDLDRDRSPFKVDSGVFWPLGKKQLKTWSKRLRSVIPNMHLWHNVVAALIPVLLSLAVHALGVAAAFGAVAIAGGAIIGLGLLGHANNWKDAMAEAKKEVTELGKAIFSVSSPARMAFAPIQTRLFNQVPDMSRGMFQSMSGLTVFAPTVEDSVRGIFEWLEKGFDIMAKYEPVVSQLADRFGRLTGDLIIDGIVWLIEEASNNQNTLVMMGSVIIDLAQAFYMLFTFAVRVLTVLKPLVEVFHWFVKTITSGLIGEALFILIGGFVGLITYLFVAVKVLGAFIFGLNVVVGLAKGVAIAFGLIAKGVGALSLAMVPLVAKLLLITALLLAIWELFGDAPLMPDFGGGADGPGNDLWRPGSLQGPGGGIVPSPTGNTGNMGRSGGATALHFNYYGDGSHKDREGFADVAQTVARQEYTTLSNSEIPDRHSTNPDR